MKRVLSYVLMLGIITFGLSLFAQQQAPAQQQPRQQVDTGSGQTARNLEGKIVKSGNQLMFQEAASQTTYQLDDQDKAKQFEGKKVKVVATVDPTSNLLHVVDIASAEGK